MCQLWLYGVEMRGRRSHIQWVGRQECLLEGRAAAGVCLGSTHAADEARDVIAQCPWSEEAEVGVP